MTTTPQAHARLSPSGSKGWFACPGKLILEAAFPGDNHNEHSDDGTAMHDVAAQCLIHGHDAAPCIGTWVVVSHAGEVERKVQITEDMADLVQGYVDYVRREAEGGDLHVEQRVSFSRFIATVDQFGTADAVIVHWAKRYLKGIDLKTGYTPVAVEANSQALIYVLAMLGELYEQALLEDDLTGTAARTPELVDPHDYRAAVFDWAEQHFDTIKVAIYQPKVYDAPAEWECSLVDLRVFAIDLHLKADAVRIAEAQHARMPMDQWWPIYLNPDPTEEACAFCRARPLCPSTQRKLQAAAMMEFGPVAEGTVAIPEPATYTPVELSKAMAVTGLMEDWIISVRAETERRLLNGEEVEGWGLELGRQGNRTFTDPEAAETLLRKTMRLRQEDIYHYKLKTPTQLEKLTKPGKGEDGKPTPPAIGPRQWPKVQALIGRAEAKPSVKPKAVIKIPYTPPKLSAEGFEAVPEDTVDDDDLSS